MSGEAEVDAINISSSETKINKNPVKSNELNQMKEPPIETPNEKQTAGKVIGSVSTEHAEASQKVPKANDKQSNCILFYGVTYLGKIINSFLKALYAFNIFVVINDF